MKAFYSLLLVCFFFFFSLPPFSIFFHCLLDAVAEDQSHGDISQVWVVVLTHHQTRAWPSSLLEGVCAETGASGFAGSDALCGRLPHDGPMTEGTNVCAAFAQVTHFQNQAGRTREFSI